MGEQSDATPANAEPLWRRRLAALKESWGRRLAVLRKPIVVIAALGTVAGGLAGWYHAYRAVDLATAPSASPPPRQQPLSDALFSILVLPLENQTGDAAKDYVAAALTSALIVDLSRIQGAVVAPPLTAVTLSDRKLSVHELGTAVGVRYVLQGAVQAAGDRLRISAQLLDTRTGAPLWTERFEGSAADLFALQDDVTTRVRAAVGPTMTLREAAEAEKRPDSKAAADLTLRAMALRLQPTSLQQAQQMERLSRQVLDANPESIAAMEMLAHALTLQVLNFRLQAGLDQQAGTRMLAEAATVARRIIAKSPSNAYACLFLANDALLVRPDVARQPVVAKEWAERAVANDPNNWRIRNNVATLYSSLGEFERARTNIERSLDLPRFGDSPVVSLNVAAGIAIAQGRLEDAMALTEKSRSASDSVDVYLALAYIYGLQGKEQEARKAGAEILRRAPYFKINSFLDTKFEFPWLGKEAEYREYITRLVRALQLAGLPD